MKAEFYTLDEVIERFSAHCRDAGGQNAWGRRHGFTAQHISAVIAGRTGPSPRILEAIGMRRVTVYVDADFGESTEAGGARRKEG